VCRERGETRTLSAFEAAAFKRACEAVLARSDGAMAAAVGAQLRRQTAAVGGHVAITYTELYDMQRAACRQSRCAALPEQPHVRDGHSEVRSLSLSLTHTHALLTHLSFTCPSHLSVGQGLRRYPPLAR
jgi:hypothetical protein